MVEKKLFFPKFSKKRLFQIISFSGLIIFIVSVYFSIINYENYIFFEQALSELGVGPGAFYFNIGIILTGICLIPFYAIRYSKSRLSKAGALIGVLSAISLVGVGTFPLNFIFEHTIAAFLFFFFSAIAIFLIALEEYFSGKTDAVCMSELILSLTILVYIFILRNPFMQKLAVALIVLWVLMMLIEEGVLEFQLRISKKK